MNPMPKVKNYRNPKLLDLAKEAPHCMRCQVGNFGQVVGAHSDSQTDGKGMGIKANDVPIAYLCDRCHGIVSGVIEPHGWTALERREEWKASALKTWLWLMQSGHLVTK